MIKINTIVIDVSMKDANKTINRDTMGAMKKWLPDAVALLSIAVLVISFFWKFFFPVPQLLVTTDFGRSDAWHFSFPTKFLLSQSLKAGSLPVWTNKLGTGFPVLAEGQTGTFFLPNLFLYTLFDAVTAYNISFVLVALSVGWGMYVFFRMLRYSVTASWFSGITFAYSGLVMTELPHITLLQGFSLLPWVLCATHYLATKKSLLGVFLMAILINQQLFAGFPQAVVITLLFAGGYYLFSIFHSDYFVIPAKAGIHQDGSLQARMTKDILRFSLSVLLALGLSAIQLFPSYEFLQQSSARGGFSPQDAAYFSYPFKHLLTFVDPYRLGNPKFGTYPIFSAFDGSIFWENTGFIGIIPLFFAIIGFFSFARRRLSKLTLFFVMAFLLSFLLMLGSHGPLYIVYSVWPLNLFRVPSRFLWTFVFCLIFFAAKGIQFIQTSFARRGLARIMLWIFIIFNVFSLTKTWQGYQATAPAQDWLKTPEIVKLLDTTSRIYDIGNEITHNETFFTKGWQNMQPYDDLRGTLAPDSNIFWNISSQQVYAGRFLRRSALVDSLLKQSIQVDASAATISGQTKKITDFFGVGQIISTVPIDNPDLVQQGTSGTTYVYTNPHATKRTYLAHTTVLVKTVEDAIGNIQKDSFITGSSAITEQAIPISDTRDGGEVIVTHETDTSTTIAVRANSAVSLLVLMDTYYPGWHAFVDGQETKIFPVNISGRGVIVDPGNHTVQFIYDPQSLRVGSLVSALTLGAIILIGFLRFSATVRTHPNISSRLQHPLRNRGRSRPRIK